ncbi:MAG: 50S ribosomal protein L18Ae [Candidatus Hermodarchaeia archaeon]|jgi:large subunit ribosomal protein LX
MSVQIFRIEGTYVRIKRKYRFSQEIRAVTEDNAREQLYSLLGSFHRVTRPAITIETVSIIKAEESEKPLIRKLSGID